MQKTKTSREFIVFSTCPQSDGISGPEYIHRVRETATWSEEVGCQGILIYTDNRLVDPWLVTQAIIENTTTLCPLVAVQAVYMHPYAVAKMVASLGYMHNRRIYLNMVAGGFKRDLDALNDRTPHDQRYDRLIEFTTIVMALLRGSMRHEAFSYDGQFYGVENLRLAPTLPPGLEPRVFVSGSSTAGIAAGKALGATIIEYPREVGSHQSSHKGEDIEYGIRVGIIARNDETSAWDAAHERFPLDRRGQITHQIAMKASDSVWHEQLSDDGGKGRKGGSPYWLVPFENYATFCPYLVGAYDRVASELRRYFDLGYETVILDVPPSREELEHIRMVFDVVS